MFILPIRSGGTTHKFNSEKMDLIVTLLPLILSAIALIGSAVGWTLKFVRERDAQKSASEIKHWELREALKDNQREDWQGLLVEYRKLIDVYLVRIQNLEAEVARLADDNKRIQYLEETIERLENENLSLQEQIQNLAQMVPIKGEENV